MIDALLPPIPPAPAALMKVSVQTNSGSFAFDCGPSETILQAGLRQGLCLPYECATGTCGTCRARAIEGRAPMAWHDAPGLAKLKLDKGDLLMCQARAVSDCLLRVPANIAGSPDAAAHASHRHGIISRVRRLTPDVMQFDVALSRPMVFAAGQFAIIEAPGLEGGRAYLMADFAREAAQVSFILKFTPNGGLSRLLFEGGATGAQVSLFGPLGRDLFGGQGEKDILCIAHDGGFAGTLSILQWAVEAEFFSRRKVEVVFGVPLLSDAFALDRLAHYIAAADGRLSVTLAVSAKDAVGTSHPDFPQIALVCGMMQDIAATVMARRSDNMMAFIAGPKPMADATTRALIVAGLSPASIYCVRFY